MDATPIFGRAYLALSLLQPMSVVDSYYDIAAAVPLQVRVDLRDASYDFFHLLFCIHKYD